MAAGHPEGTAGWVCFFVAVAGDVPDVVEGLAVFRQGSKVTLHRLRERWPYLGGGVACAAVWKGEENFNKN